MSRITLAMPAVPATAPSGETGRRFRIGDDARLMNPCPHDAGTGMPASVRRVASSGNAP